MLRRALTQGSGQLRRFGWLFLAPAALVAAGAVWQTPGAAAVGLGLAAGMALATSI